MKILLLATRDPWGRATGRKVVLRTIISSLQKNGHDVSIVVFQRHKDSPRAQERCTALPLPGGFRVLWNIMYHFTRKKLSLNECLYFSPKNAGKLQTMCKQLGAELVIADMIRTAPYAARLGKPWILDLDDLLSNRYRDMVTQKLSTDMLLGYFSKHFPRIFKTLFSMFVKFILTKEAALIAERELFFAGRADAVCLVAEDEAQELSSRLKKRVFSVPMAIEAGNHHVPDILKRPMSLVFMGGLDYQPNLEAVRFYLHDIVPALLNAGVSNTVLTVIGFCPPSVKEELRSRHLNLLGYVEDVEDELSRHQLFLAPIISGTGIKTKVLEAMTSGLPVLSSPQGVKGLKIESGTECFIARSPDEFAQLLRFIEANPQKALNVAAAGRQFVKINFSPQVLAEKWNEVIRAATR